MNTKKDNIKKTYDELNKLGKEAFNDMKHKETRIKQIPNMLTASRLFSPLFIIPSALTGNLLLTAIFTGMFALTDAFDGLLARKLKCTSEFGRKLDPITDKVFAGSLLIPVTVLNPIMLINFCLEGAIALININSEITNKSPKTSMLGKVKTWFLYTTIAISYLNTVVTLDTILLNTFIFSTTALQLGTGIKYYTDSKKKEFKEKKMEVIFSKEETKKEIENEEIKKLKEYKNYILNKQNEYINSKENDKKYIKNR